MPVKNRAGQKFGKLTVSDKWKRENGRTFWYVHCDCGGREWMEIRKASNTKQFPQYCSNCRQHGFRAIDETGNIYGKLLVIKRTKDHKFTNTGAFWLCKCQCGKGRTVRGYDLRFGRVTGCYDCMNMILPGSQAARNMLYSIYRHKAKERGYTFELSKKEFTTLTSQRCHYCNVEPAQARVVNVGDNYIYNGIDRMDNDRGYTVDNCVSSCGKCNKAKLTMDYDEFLGWIEDIYNNRIDAIGVEIKEYEDGGIVTDNA